MPDFLPIVVKSSSGMEPGPNSVYLPLVARNNRRSTGTRDLMTRDPSRDDANQKTGRKSGETSSRPQWASGKAGDTTTMLHDVGLVGAGFGLLEWKGARWTRSTILASALRG